MIKASVSSESKPFIVVCSHCDNTAEVDTDEEEIAFRAVERQLGWYRNRFNEFKCLDCLEICRQAGEIAL